MLVVRVHPQTLMKINKELVKKVAKISRISITEKEVSRFADDFKAILRDFSKLKKINTDCVKPTFSGFELQNVMRDDRTKKCLSNEQALSNTKNQENGFFKGPKTI